MLDGNVLSYFIDGTQLTVVGDPSQRLFSAKDEDYGAVDSVSFRGTGYVDNFAASSEAKAEIQYAYIADYTAYLDNEVVDWAEEDILLSFDYMKGVALNGAQFKVADLYDESYDGDILAAIKLVSGDEVYELVKVDGQFTGDTDDIVLEEFRDDQGYLYYAISVDTDNLVADAEYSFEFYYGEYTPSEPEPEPDPEPEFAPVAVTGITVDGDTVTLAIDGEYTEVQVYFSETVDGTFTVIDSTFEDGVATVTSTTATGFFKVEAK